MGAFFIASMSMFTSCKDYDDDLNNHESQIKELQAQIAALQGAGYAKTTELQTAKADLDARITALNSTIESLRASIPTVPSGLATQDWVAAQQYALQKDLSDAVSRLAAVEALTSQIATINTSIDALKDQLNSKANQSDLNKVVSDISTIDATLITLAGKIEGVEAADAKLESAIATANNNIEKQQALIDELQKALAGVADNTELNKLASTVKELQEKVNSIDPLSGTNFAEQLNALTGRVDALQTLKADLDKVKAQIESAATIGEVQVLIQDASNALDKKFSEAVNGLNIQNVNILNFLVEKGLTSIVLKPKYYLGGIEAIDLPFVVRQPEIFLDPNVTSKPDENIIQGSGTDKDLLGRASKADNWTRGDRYERWINLKGRTYTDDEAIHWPDGLENFLPAKLGEYSDTYSYYREEDAKLFDGNFAYKYYRYVDIVPTGHAFYHLNPNTANLEGQSLYFYTNFPWMTLVTRYQVNDGDPLLYQDKELTAANFNLDNAKVENGVLDVPFHLNVQAYLNTWGKNFVDAFDAANGYGSVAVSLNQNGYGADENGIVYPQGTDASLNQSSYDSGLNEVSIKMPFVAAQITGEGRTITSDYAALLPSFVQLIALADSLPDTRIAKGWSQIDHNAVEANHLYRTPDEAIDGAATHQLVYNDEQGINLDEFIQVHAFRFGTRFSRDYALTPEELAEYGLHFEYTIVDYASEKYNDEQSNHCSLINKEAGRHTGNTIVARVVDAETGATIDDFGSSSIGREPLVRVMLVHNDYNGDEHILLKGYVKFRIVRQLEQDLVASIPLNADGEPVYMGCEKDDNGNFVYSGLGIAKWSQMERYILDATGVDLSKAQFDQTYMLETNPNYLGAKRYVEYPAGSGKFYDEATWVKQLEIEYKTTGLTLEQSVLSNIGFAKEYFKAFAGYVGYTGWEGTEGEAGTTIPAINDILAKQQNVLYWSLGAYNDATAHTYINGSVSNPRIDEKYIEYIAKVGNDGLSQEDVYTWVKFIPRNGVSANPIYVKLYIPAGKLQWAAGDMRGQKLAKWYEYQSNTSLLAAKRDAKKATDNVFEIHVNAPIQKIGSYTQINEKDFIYDMSEAFQDGVRFTNLTQKKDENGATVSAFPGFTGGTGATTNLSQDKVSFYFTLPSKSTKANADFDAAYVTNAQKFNSRAMADSFLYQGYPVKVWQARGHSGKIYTLALANKNEKGKLQTWEIKQTLDTKEVRDYTTAIYQELTTGSHTPTAQDIKSLYNKVQSVERGQYIVAIREVGFDIPSDFSKQGDAARLGYNPQYELVYDEPVVIAQLENTKGDWGTPNGQALVETAAAVKPQNNYFRYNENAVAEDLLNAQAEYNKFGNSAFAPTDNLYLDAKQEGPFTAYVEVVYNDVFKCETCDLGCYEIFDPNNTRFFNIRVLRPLYLNSGSGEITQDALNEEATTTVRFGFHDWRYYTIADRNDDSKSTIVPTYYSVEVDADYYGVTDVLKNINITPALLDEIRTDVFTDAKETDFIKVVDASNIETETRIPVDVNSLQGRIYVNTLPVASKFASNASASGSGSFNSNLDLNGSGDKLVYRNIGSNTRAFNLYVPVYYSYIFGDGELASGILPWKVNDLVNANVYGADYANADAAGIAKKKYVYFRDRRTNAASQINYQTQGWYVIKVIKTKPVGDPK